MKIGKRARTYIRYALKNMITGTYQLFSTRLLFVLVFSKLISKIISSITSNCKKTKEKRVSPFKQTTLFLYYPYFETISIIYGLVVDKLIRLVVPAVKLSDLLTDLLSGML